MAMDPFTGLGSTAVACAKLGIKFIGSEIDEMYLREAVARAEEAAGHARAPRAQETSLARLPARGAMKKAELAGVDRGRRNRAKEIA
jgi:site-specific DNA-methyltransferase (adenine-specific)